MKSQLPPPITFMFSLQQRKGETVVISGLLIVQGDAALKEVLWPPCVLDTDCPRTPLECSVQSSICCFPV